MLIKIIVFYDKSYYSIELSFVYKIFFSSYYKRERIIYN